MATFGELLRRHRVAASLTQADLADQSGLSRRAIADLERGARARPREATLARIVAALRLNAPERAQLEAAALHGAGDPDRVALLPAPLSSFIGRESERSELVSLARARRLVTLTGAGGIGRTRLAIEVATELQHEYTSGARMVDLAAIASPLHVLTACAATVQALLENCRELHVLATSRQPLGIDGEVAWRVPALGLPARDEDFVHAESVRLFGERASAANREFRLTSANAPAVLDVCRRLDGIPLAIELAAARARMFSVEQIAWHLGNQSLAWSSAAHATPARHTTLRAAIEWSYALLTPTEQALFRRLAVFAGSFSLQAAEAVCAGELAAIPDSAEVLCGLIDKSLVLAETRPTGEVRYRLLETLRQYAVERLHEAHEEHAVRMRQLDWLVTLTERADPVHGGPDEPPYLALVPLEYDNCRAALEWAAQTPAAATLGLKLVIRLYRYWLINGLMNEGRRSNVLLRDAVTTLGLGPSLDLAWSLFLDSTLTVFQGEFDEGQRLAEAAVAMAQVLDQPAMAAEFRGLLATQQANRGDLASAAANNAAALAVLRTTGPEASLAGTLMGAATVARLQGDDAQAIRFTEESLRIMQRIGLDFYVGHVVSGLGLLYLRRGQLDRARQYFEQALDGRRARGERTGVLGSLRDLGQVALAEGDLRSAQRYFEESLAITRELGDRSDTAQTLRALGKVSAERGDIRSGLRLLQDALRLQAELGHTLQVPDTLEDVASLAARSGQALAAVRLFAATTSARKRIGSMSDDRQAAIVRMAQRALGLHVFDAAWTAGEMLSLEDAIDEALRLEVAEPEARRSPDGGAELTPREREVAVLLASGLSNRAIADRLVISEATAEVHVRHILAKLGFSSRAQVAAWAAERGALGAR